MKSQFITLHCVSRWLLKRKVRSVFTRVLPAAAVLTIISITVGFTVPVFADTPNARASATNQRLLMPARELISGRGFRQVAG